jgi:hypothetical protein
MHRLIEVLEKSVAKHGSIPLTTSHLLNIIKLVQRMDNIEEENMSKLLDEAAMEAYRDQCCDRE